MSIKLDEYNEDLVFYNEEAETEDTETEGTEEDDFSQYDENPFTDRSLLDQWVADDTGDVEFLEKLRQLKAERRAKRRKTGRTTGNFLIELLTMLTFSPTRFFAGWDTFSKFLHLGESSLDGNDRIAGKLYKRKKYAFCAGILTLSFILPTISELIGFGLGAWGLKVAIVKLGSGGFFHKLWFLVVAIVAYAAAWNFFKSILKSIIGVMEESYNTVTEAKNKADKARKAQEEKKRAAEKAVEEARKQRQKQKIASKTGDPASKPTQPVRPSGRGRYRQSGG